MTATFRLAAIQAAPILFDKEASTEKACTLIEKAGEDGADLAVFGETWLPGYPFWVEGGVVDLTWEASANYLENAIDLDGPEIEALCAAARIGGTDVVIGVAERDPYTEGTAYCTAVSIGREGVVLNRHRKLKPTHAERIIWGDGDGAGLTVQERDYAKISALNCWEHQMMLARLHACSARDPSSRRALARLGKEPCPNRFLLGASTSIITRLCKPSRGVCCVRRRRAPEGAHSRSMETAWRMGTHWSFCDYRPARRDHCRPS